MDTSRGTAVKLFGGWGSLFYHPGGQNTMKTQKTRIIDRKKKKSEKNLVENDESS